ncbi:ABC-2 family transporter protein [Oscillospiraceae bacterium PP1C4]
MNLKGGIALIKKSFFSYTVTRGFFWTLALGWMMMPIIYMLVWVVAAGNGSVFGFTKNDFVVYYTVLIFVNQLTYPVSHWTVGDSIFNGTFSNWLLRPLPPIYEAIASDIAVKVICVPFTAVFTLGMVIIFGIQISLTAINSLLFIVCLLLAQILRFMLAYTLSLLALFTNKIHSFLSINDILIFLFAGQVIPTMLLPGIIRNISFVLPYRYMLGFPIEILLGKLSDTQVAFGMSIQLIWILIVLMLNLIIWKKGIRHYSSIGG